MKKELLKKKDVNNLGINKAQLECDVGSEKEPSLPPEYSL